MGHIDTVVPLGRASHTWGSALAVDDWRATPKAWMLVDKIWPEEKIRAHHM